MQPCCSHHSPNRTIHGKISSHSIFPDSSARWYYPVETVIAEKFGTLVALGIANTRLKDFYDLWFIAQTFELRQSILAESVRRTFERRGSALPTGIPVGLTDEFVVARDAQWRAFLSRDRMAAAPDMLAVVVTDPRAFLMPLLDAANSGEHTWRPSGPWTSAVRAE